MRRLGILAGVACLLLLVAAGSSWAQSDPAAPTINSVTAGYQSLSVNWAVPSGINDSDITFYDLRHIASNASDKADDNWSLTEDLTSARRWTILEGLTDGTQYDVQVRIVTDTDGAWSSTSTGTPGGPGSTFETATAIDTNITVVGHLSSTSDTDFFKFELTETSELVLFTAGPFDANQRLTAGTVHTVGSLYDSSQKLIRSDQGRRNLTHGPNNFLLTETLALGTYYSSITSNTDDIGTYRFFLNGYKETTGINNARTIHFNSLINGILGDNTDQDYFRLTLDVETSIHTVVRGSFDSVIELLNSSGQRILINDDGLVFGPI